MPGITKQSVIKAFQEEKTLTWDDFLAFVRVLHQQIQIFTHYSELEKTI